MGLQTIALIMMFATSMANAGPRQAQIQCRGVGPTINAIVDFPQASDCKPKKNGTYYDVSCSKDAMVDYVFDNSPMHYEGKAPSLVYSLWHRDAGKQWLENEVKQFSQKGFLALNDRTGVPSFVLKSSAAYEMTIEFTAFSSDGQSVTEFFLTDTKDSCSGKIP